MRHLPRGRRSIGIQELHPDDAVRQVPLRRLEGPTKPVRRIRRERGTHSETDGARAVRVAGGVGIRLPLRQPRGAQHRGIDQHRVWRRSRIANKAKLENVFRNIDFNSEAGPGADRRNAIGRLKHLLEDFSDPRLDLRPSRIGNLDVIGNAYEYLIGQIRRRRREEGRGVLHPAGSVGTAGQAARPQAGRPDLRSGLRFGLAAASKCAKEVSTRPVTERELLSVRPGVERQHLGTVPR